MDLLSQMFKSAMEMDRSAVVICDLQHTIVYMNPAAIQQYEKWGGEALVGKSLMGCHNEKSCEMIEKVTVFPCQITTFGYKRRIRLYYDEQSGIWSMCG